MHKKKRVSISAKRKLEKFALNTEIKTDDALKIRVVGNKIPTSKSLEIRRSF